MNDRFIACATAVAAVLGGCSGQDATAPRPPGSLPAGTAEIGLDGAGLGKTNDVSCTTAGAVTTINTGDESAGTTSSVDSSDELTVQYAEMRNIDGFTGSFWADLGSQAEVNMTEGTFHITGTATGFDDSNPSARASKTFSIRVSC
jgi:lipoprotein LpqH